MAKSDFKKTLLWARGREHKLRREFELIVREAQTWQHGKDYRYSPLDQQGHFNCEDYLGWLIRRQQEVLRHLLWHKRKLRAFWALAEACEKGLSGGVPNG
jgi:hypothetical protein